MFLFQIGSIRGDDSLTDVYIVPSGFYSRLVRLEVYGARLLGRHYEEVSIPDWFD